ncbi:MAG TPA: hypothetical protein PKE12_14450 [Kiritimatiellia bacterium]|nr:hypothetical protein [Kiritimatiellia bacterium]
MKATVRKILFPVGVIWFLALFIAGFMAYFVSSAGPSGPCDGLGRPLSQAPILMRIFFGQERMWAGWLWFVGEMVLFWGSIAVAINIGKWLED